jgi:hypothetical protein
MALKTRLESVAVLTGPKPLFGPLCRCRAEFFREEIAKHHRCLERHREYYSPGAIASAEDALARIMADLETLCQRDDAADVMCKLLRKLDLVTNLSAWTDPQTLH